MDMTMAARPSGLRQAATFGQHFLQMCVAMCMVGTPIVLAVFRWAPATFGVPSPVVTAPELALLAVAAIYATPMALWMRYRGMAWRPIAEMAGAAMAVAVGLIALEAFGVLTASGFSGMVGPTFCGPACAAMVLVMLARLPLYTGRDGHHMHHGMAH
jgi:hypothetical protein